MIVAFDLIVLILFVVFYLGGLFIFIQSQLTIEHEQAAPKKNLSKKEKRQKRRSRSISPTLLARARSDTPVRKSAVHKADSDANSSAESPRKKYNLRSRKKSGDKDVAEK